MSYVPNPVCPECNLTSTFALHYTQGQIPPQRLDEDQLVPELEPRSEIAGYCDLY